MLTAATVITGYSAIALLLEFEVPFVRHEGGPSMGHGEVQFFGFRFPFWQMPLFAAIGFASGAIAYYVIFPEINPRIESNSSKVIDPLDAVMRVLEPDERRLVEALKEAGGRMLQKEAARKIGFTRVKTHRVVARLARRGVISVQKLGKGKTNQIAISSWLYRTLGREELIKEARQESSAK
jgi:hypothetical protein